MSAGDISVSPTATLRQYTLRITDSDVDAILAHLFETNILFADGAIVMLGPEGEARYGAKHFLELFSVFNTPPVATVYHGVDELGQVDPLSFLRAVATSRPCSRWAAADGA